MEALGAATSFCCMKSQFSGRKWGEAPCFTSQPLAGRVRTSSFYQRKGINKHKIDKRLFGQRVQWHIGCARRVGPLSQSKALIKAIKEEASLNSTPAKTQVQDTLVAWGSAFYRFSRPHTIIGTAIGVISVSLLAIQSPSDISSNFLIGLLQALIPALFMNVYIVGLNQIYDIDIDKVTKPYLPLASGEYSIVTGVVIVAFCAVMSLGIGALVNSAPLLWALTVSFALGTAYSVKHPVLRWKRSAVAAASCILCVRAVVVQLAFYLHMQVFVLKRKVFMTKSLLFATGFMCFFSVVIALFKDIPDVEGDKIYGIYSFAVRLGQRRVFWLCIWMLLSAYAAAILIGATSPVLWSKVAMVAGHAILATFLWSGAHNLDLSSKSAISAFYMFIWKLFYAEYLLIPFMR
ncbi:hypothetical protein O6H91_14G067300 [Diphasiastrum complanatum]|uniref:Uncharacterized protein n=1 Tax=Diphasiastrum complanatum TaxID=34168 RepID=A0ACC2BQ92_DIPCM|nr:hypothetical protein O6H91_14G067300 [Diphasiastrum complanatum]